MAITKDAGRQTTLVAVVDFTFATLTSGSAEGAVDLPNGAVVTGGQLVVDTAFNSGTSDTISVGDGVTAARYESAQSVASTGAYPLTVTGYEYTAADAVDITLTSVGAAATAGAGRLVVEYYVEGRANEVQA